ncbi:hypothetical protein BGW38_010418 [Lunasporangiospora selenospora]|uniref:DUF4460 domain-containing protein n=1 Tax=Lunasporangiospora selenospora TaxID=979761 RepID=A0A9P6KFQ6_9FUNG|nr:hypothetical protein BGW38_010418 [Lunasporangiospora selenospora]
MRVSAIANAAASATKDATRDATKLLQQKYIQQHLKAFLRRVHPDLFQHHPKEQLQNSESLQFLLPLVTPSKSHSRPSTSTPSNPNSSDSAKKLAFYFRGTSTHNETISTTGDEVSPQPLVFIEHSLPVVDPLDSNNSSKQDRLDHEAKSWFMVQSFLELCRKVGVAVKETDFSEVTVRLDESTKSTEATKRRSQPQRPLSEIFAEELQGSFSGSSGHVGSQALLYPKPLLSKVRPGLEGSFGPRTDVNNGYPSYARLGKTGGPSSNMDADMMIASNPLLFMSPDLSKKKLKKFVRTWIYWQEEDRNRSVGDSMRPEAMANRVESFDLVQWWRKVPVMVMSSATERAQALKAPSAQEGKAILVVDIDMSKEEMTAYLAQNIPRVEAEYRALLQKYSAPPGGWSSAPNS